MSILCIWTQKRVSISFSLPSLVGRADDDGVELDCGRDLPHRAVKEEGGDRRLPGQVRMRATFSELWAQCSFPNNTVGEARTWKRGRDERAVVGHFAGFSRLSGSNTPQRQTKQG